MAITGWFVGLVALGALPLIAIGSPWVLPIWLLFCLALGGIDVLLAASPRSVRVSRGPAARLRLGESASSEVTITNVGLRELRVTVRDGWQPSAGAGPRLARLVIPSHERRTARQVLTPWRRGVRRSDHVTLRSMGPMRLAARQVTLRCPGEVTVLPPFHARRHLPSRLARLRELDGATSLMVRGQGTEFDSLRDYVRGDDVRSIDWRATARRLVPGPQRQHKPVVRTWRPERDRRVVIVIDSGRLAATRIDNETRIDSYFESALLLAALASAAGDHVELVIVDQRVRARVRHANGAALLPALVDAMAEIEPELLEVDWAQVPSLVRQATTQRSLVVLLTALDSAGSVRSLLGMLPQLTASHRVIVGSVVDPEVARLRERRDRVDDVYRAASAERASASQLRVAAAARRLGVDVVTDAPRDLPPAIADRYLAMKAAGLL